MGFKIKNSLTGEFEKLPILTLKGEKGETGGVEEYNKVDYMGNKYETLKQANDANVEYAVKTAIGEFNYLDYDGQHITATDTIEGRSKSAILKGNSIKNYKNNLFDNVLEKGAISISTGAPNESNLRCYRSVNFIPINGNFKIAKYGIDGDLHVCFYDSNKSFISGQSYVLRKVLEGNATVTPPTNSSFIKFYNPYDDNEPTGEFGFGVMAENEIIELEIQSVKMPVLTTTGKNLVNPNTLITGTIENPSLTAYKHTPYIKIEPNTSYSFRLSDYIFWYDENKELSGESKQGWGTEYRNYTSPINAKYVRLNINSGSFAKYNTDWTGVSIIKSTTNVYEPYKSNILSTPEDLELRAIGDVKDTLDLMTGELTQRIGLALIDGSVGGALPYGHGDPRNGTICLEFGKNSPIYMDGPLKNSSTPYISQQLPYRVGIGADYCYIAKFSAISSSAIVRVPGNTAKEARDWLKNNPITFIYELETPIIKTVDLSDNHVYSYKDVTHYDCSSAEGSLVPTLSVKVPTDVQATIAQQRETIQTLNSENERLNQIQEALKASMLDSQVQLMNLSWDIDFEVFTLRESIAPKDSLLYSRTGSNIDKFSQAKFIIENDCPNLEKLNSQIEYYFSKDVFSQEQFEELTDLISIVKGENGCEY